MKKLTWTIEANPFGSCLVAGLGDGRTAFLADAKSGGGRLPAPDDEHPVLLTIRDDETEETEYLFEVGTGRFARQLAAMVADGELVVHTGYRGER